MVHARAVLDAVMPVIQKRTAGVRAELAGLRQTHRQQAVALRALAASKTELADRRDELTRLENEGRIHRSEEHTSELQSLMRISYAVFCLKKKNRTNNKESDLHSKIHEAKK